MMKPAIKEWQIERGYPFSFTTEASVDLASDEEMMRMMAEARFEAVFLGIETPDEASLSVAGVDGTLRRRFDDAGDGLVRGKTGSLNSVNCVTGYVRGSDGDMYVFTVLANDVEKGRAARSIQDQVAQTIMKGLGAPPLQR